MPSNTPSEAAHKYPVRSLPDVKVSYLQKYPLSCVLEKFVNQNRENNTDIPQVF